MRHNYPKAIGRVSSFFVFMATLEFLGGIVIVILLFQEKVAVRGSDPLLHFALGAAFYAAHIALDFLLDLGEKIIYIERIQEQQNKVLNELHRAAKETETLS